MKRREQRDLEQGPPSSAANPVSTCRFLVYLILDFLSLNHYKTVFIEHLAVGVREECFLLQILPDNPQV